VGDSELSTLSSFWGPPQGAKLGKFGILLQVMKEIIDDNIRQMLVMDGGNMEILDIKENGEHTDIYIRYLGACSGCAASSLGTLYAIGNTLREKFGENIRVSPV